MELMKVTTTKYQVMLLEPMKRFIRRVDTHTRGGKAFFWMQLSSTTLKVFVCRRTSSLFFQPFPMDDAFYSSKPSHSRLQEFFLNLRRQSSQSSLSFPGLRKSRTTLSDCISGMHLVQRLLLYFTTAPHQ